MSRTHGAALVAFALLVAAPAIARTSRNVTQLANIDAYGTNYSACCTYVHTDGREYAVLGESNGSAIYNVTNPSAPALVGVIAGPSSAWREMKQYRNWLYVVSEGVGTGRGLQVIRMTDPEHPVLVKTYTATFTTAHTVTIDTTRALLYANGTSSGMHCLSLASPESPVELGVYTTYYVHDLFARGTRGYAACINDGLEVVLDMTTPGTFSQLASWRTPNSFTHNSWVTPDARYIYCTDETSSPPGTLSFYDISNLAQVKYLGQYLGHPSDIVHNVHGKGDTLFVSYYTAGMRMFDIHDPEVPVEIGFLDTSTNGGPSYHGLWEVDANLPSGLVIGSDIENGLYTARTVLAYGTVRGTVRDAVTNAVLPGAGVLIVEAGKTLKTYPGTGKYGFSPSTPGAYTLRVSATGYATVDVQVIAVNGVQLIQDVALVPVASTSFAAGAAPSLIEATPASPSAAGAPVERLGAVSVSAVGSAPTFGTSLVRFTLGQREPVSVQVFDVGGSLVRTLSAQLFSEAGPHSLAWDGRDEIGRRVRAGVYLVRVSVPGTMRIARLLHL